MKTLNSKTNEPKRYVLDSYAILAFLNNEVSKQAVDQYLQKAQSGEVSLYLNAINLGEIYYIIAKRYSFSQAAEIPDIIRNWAISLVQVDTNFILAAAHWKAQYKISYADAFCIETAHQIDCPLLTGDPEILKIKEIKVMSV